MTIMVLKGFLNLFARCLRGGEEGETPAGEEPTGGEPEGMNFLIGGDDFPSAAGDPGGELDLPSLDDWDDLLGDSA